MSYTAWRRLRRGVQVLALALFLYLLLGTTQGGNTFLPHDLFFRLDPLAGLSAMLAGREWIAPLALGAVTLLLVFVLAMYGAVGCVRWARCWTGHPSIACDAGARGSPHRGVMLNIFSC